MKLLIPTLICLIAISSCVSQKNQHINEHILTLKNSYCKAPQKYNYEKELPSYNADSILLANADLRNDFSEQSILILNALNSLDEVKTINELKKDNSLESRVKILELKNSINNKITIALTELDAVAAEFDCEGERVEQMASYLQNMNDNRNNKLVIYSIVAGAAASVASGIIKSDSWGTAVDIGGGVLGAGLGFATLNPKGKKIEFIHQRNLLRDIWTQKLESENFPPFVWYMYTEKKFSNHTDGKSIIGNIKGRWLEFNFENNMQEANQSVNFGIGGTYTAQELYNRSRMLNQMQSATRTINQNINYLLLDLDKLVMY
ncbi:hypothetical protein [Empedobacter stercoris]|uniref:hypothetical protein n=1 Tax=Empedobacter stercoris TaxID=1628248 RepID=UPI001B356597|nr:hypothetical protein [Empedobacter stercoris]